MEIGRLAKHIHRTRTIPQSAVSTPWLTSGNIILITHQHAFKFHKRTLTLHSTKFAERIAIMNDGNTDIVDDCPVLEVPFATSFDLGNFLAALDVLHNDPDALTFPLATLEEFNIVQGVIRIATISNTNKLRTRAIAALQVRYPTTLAQWDVVRPPLHTPPLERDDNWEWDRALIINLARQVGAFSILPAAMAMLTNDCSAGEVFGIRLPPSHHPPPPQSLPTSPVDVSLIDNDPFSPIDPTPSIPPPRERTALNDRDGQSFALLKEHHHQSIVSLLLTIRSIGSSCTRCPDLIPRKTGFAPVGSSSLLPSPSGCSKFFKETSARLLEVQVLEHPVGYAEFVWNVIGVDGVKQDKERTCRYCWKEFEQRCKEEREKWWERLPMVLGWERGWEDEELREVVGDDSDW